MSVATLYQDWQSPEAIAEWWSSPTQQSFARIYSAETVANLRDPVPEGMGASQMAMKLLEILESHRQAGTGTLAMSATEAVSAQMMAEAGFETLYVSGGMTSMTDTSTDDPSTDLADYTYDTVPNKVKSIYRSQLLHSRTSKAWQTSSSSSLMPMIADADSGHGLHSAVMKLVKLFVQAGAACIHIDDLLSESKRFDGSDGIGYVVVPLSEHVRRLRAAKLQLDIMGSEMLLMYRTDCETATHITSTIGARDRPFILGATVKQETELSGLASSERSAWKNNAKLQTLDEAFTSAFPDLVDIFIERSKGMTVSQALSIAHELAPSFYWSCDAARTYQGWYPFRGGVEASISRALICAPMANIVWSCTTSYNPQAAASFAQAVQSAYPGKLMGYNVTGGVPSDGSMDDIIKSLPAELGKMGYVWQFLPISGLTALGLGMRRAADAVKKDGVLGYIQSCSRPCAQLQGQESVEWWWKRMGKLTDTAAEAIGDGTEA